MTAKFGEFPPIVGTNDTIGARLRSACLSKSGCPKPRFGRTQWLIDRFLLDFGEVVSPGNIDHWFYDRKTLDTARCEQLGKILGVDPAWLCNGSEAKITPLATSDDDRWHGGAVRIVAGLIEQDGGRVGFPLIRDDADKFDLRAIIAGQLHELRVASGRRVKPGIFSFTVTNIVGDATIVGIWRDEISLRLIVIPKDRLPKHQGVPLFPLEILLSAQDLVTFKINGFLRRV